MILDKLISATQALKGTKQIFYLHLTSVVSPAWTNCKYFVWQYFCTYVAHN